MNFDIRNRLLFIVKNIGLLLILYFLLRLGFIANYSTSFADFFQFNNFYYLVIGIRFDLSAVALLSSWWVLVYLLPIDYPKIVHRFWQTLFILLHFTFVICNISDWEYSKFSGQRLTLSHLDAIASEIANQAGQIILNYWYNSFLILAVLFLLFKAYRKPHFQKKKLSLAYPLFIILSLFTLVVAARGGLQKKVLQPAHAFLYASGNDGLKILNSTFTIIKSKDEDKIESFQYFASWQEVLDNLPKAERKPQVKKQDNVVIIILESFATEFWGVANQGKGYTPFLDKLSQEGVLLRQHFADARRSIDAFPAITMSYPTLLDLPLAKSKFQFNEWHGIGSLLKTLGYQTSFYHAAESGSMYFDNAAKLAGLDDYHPKERYPNQKDFDGHWGIFDEPFFQYAANQYSNYKEPFLSVLFSLSSHQPYAIPKQHQDKFPKGPTPLHESVGYVDYSLQRFFKTAKKMDWYENTLFVITADHTQMSPSVGYNTSLGRHMVPLLFFHPNRKLKIDANQIAHQSDIVPTLLDYLGVKDVNTTRFGRSLYSDSPGRAVFYHNKSYYYVKENHLLLYEIVKNQATLYYFASNPNEIVAKDDPFLLEAMLTELTAFLQYHNNGLLKNCLYKETCD